MNASLFNKRRSTVVGLMSGTALDGIDAAVVPCTGSGLDAKVELLHYYSVPYDDELRTPQGALCSGTLVGRMNVFLAERFAEAAIEVVRSEWRWDRSI